MNIVVCIKQVPNTADVRIDPKTNTLIREGVESIINPFDNYAIEEGVRLKERYGGKVVALSMGPPQAESALREAISLGCDEGILISDKAFAGSDTWATSYTLGKAIRKIGDFDIILCGKQASDGDTAQVGPGIAVHLDIPQVTYVKKIVDIKDNTITVHRMVEEGYQVIQSPLPVLLTVVKEINEPRLPSLRGKMRAKSMSIPVFTAKDLGCESERIGLEGSPTRVIKVFNPPPRKGGIRLTGEPKEVVDKLIELIRSEVA